MNIQVSNTDGQLRVVQNGRVRFYNLKTIKSVDSLCDTNNEFYLVINFIANDKENALTIYLKDITNQATWTNTSAGAEVAKEDISGWMQDATIVSGTVSLSSSTLTALENTTVTITAAQFSQNVKPNLIISTGGSGSIAIEVYSISFASNGTAAALLSVEDGAIGTFKSIPPNTTINLDAGGLDWTYEANRFHWDTVTNAGASLIITYNSFL
jgi:hypothetical protein